VIPFVDPSDCASLSSSLNDISF